MERLMVVKYRVSQDVEPLSAFLQRYLLIPLSEYPSLLISSDPPMLALLGSSRNADSPSHQDADGDDCSRSVHLSMKVCKGVAFQRSSGSSPPGL